MNTAEFLDSLRFTDTNLCEADDPDVGWERCRCSACADERSLSTHRAYDPEGSASL